MAAAEQGGLHLQDDSSCAVSAGSSQLRSGVAIPWLLLSWQAAVRGIHDRLRSRCPVLGYSSMIEATCTTLLASHVPGTSCRCESLGCVPGSQQLKWPGAQLVAACALWGPCAYTCPQRMGIGV